MLSVRISSYDTRGKFGEHERSVSVARHPRATLKPSVVLSKLPKCIHNSIYAQLKA